MRLGFYTIIVFILLYSCSFRIPVVVDSTRQDWSIVKRNSSGTVFHLVIKSTTTNTELKIDSLCISDEIIKDFKYSVLGKSNTTTEFTKGDSVLISFNKTNNINYLKVNNCKSDGIFITLKNKKKTIKIKSYKILPPIINE